MKNQLFTITLSLLTLFTSSLYAQKDAEVAREFFWGANDAYASANDIPDKWKNESAVVIYKNENYDFHKYGKKVTFTRSVRKRVKLLDQASVKEFSDFSFSKRFRSSKGRYSYWERGRNYVGVKVVKPDGTTTEIDIEANAVEVDGEQKVAIPNLEVGDIIDYYFYQVEPFKSKIQFGFDPVEQTLSEEYPMMDYKLFLKTENDFFVNFNTYNGAPQLEEIPTEKRNTRKYQLTVSDIDKTEYPRWFYPLVELPSYKFQMYFARKSKFENSAVAFLPEEQENIKTNVSPQDVLDLYAKRFKPGMLDAVRKKFRKTEFSTNEEKVKAVYYFMRHYYLTRLLDAYIALKADIIPYLSHGSIIDSEKRFVRYFTGYLQKEDIDYDIVVAKKRYDGDLNDLLIEKNVSVLLKVKTEKPIYVELFSPYSTVNSYSSYIEGTDVYLLSQKRNKLNAITTNKLPTTTHNDNVTQKDITLETNETMSGFNVQIMSSYKGHPKTREQYNNLLFNEFTQKDHAKYGTTTFIDSRKRRNRDRMRERMDAVYQKMADKREERLKEFITNDLNLETIDDYTFEVLENGRFDFDEAFTYTESFTFDNDVIKRAGPNYIVEIGRFIGGQVSLTEEERARAENIYFNYPKSYNYTINLVIPEGYTVSGIDNLNKSVDNNTGAFISSAKIEGNMLVVETSKQYKNYFEPAGNWSQIMAFLDMANAFYGEKILLKKK